MSHQEEGFRNGARQDKRNNAAKNTLIHTNMPLVNFRTMLPAMV